MVDDFDGDAAGFRLIEGPSVFVADGADEPAGDTLSAIAADFAGVGVEDIVQLVQAHVGIDRVHLQIENRGLDQLLFAIGQMREAFGEGIGDEEVHHYFQVSEKSIQTLIIGEFSALPVRSAREMSIRYGCRQRSPSNNSAH